VAQIVNFRAEMGPKPDRGAAGGAEAGPAEPRDSVQTRALLSLLKDGMKPLDVNALDMRNQIYIFQSAIERYFKAIGVDDLDDGDPDSEETRLQVVRSVMGADAATALIGIADTEIDTYRKVIAKLTDRFAPSEDDVHSLGLLIQCRMRDDETTKQYVNRVRALVSRMSSMTTEWQTKHILAVLRFTHKSAKLRDLLAEKAPDTVAEAEKIAEAFETRVKDKPTVDRLAGALTGSSPLPIDNMRFRGNSRATPGRGVCHNCGGQGHFAKVCPSRRDTGGQPQGRGRGGGPRGVTSTNVPFRGRGFVRGAAGFRSHMPANQVGYAGYAEQAEHSQFDAWQSYQPEFPVELPPDAEHSDYSGAAAAAYAPTDNVGYGYGTPHRAPPQFLPSYNPRQEAEELCLLEADVHVNTVSSVTNEWWSTVRLPRGTLKFKVDTGAKGNVCSLHDLHRLGYSLSDLVPSNVVLVSFTKRMVRPLGTLVSKALVNGHMIPFVVHVVPKCNSPLLSLPSALLARLVTLPGRSDNDPSVGESSSGHGYDVSSTNVDEFSAYKDEVVHLQVRDNAVPKQFPPRRVPLALQNQAHFELMEMERDGIIEKVTEPSEWCHPMLVTPKPNGRLRVCMDPRYLNEFLVRAVYPFPDVDQVFASIKGAKIFAKIDLTHGFWNLRLDAASSNLCVFASPWGRFRYKRLPFGVSPAPEVFHRVVADVIRDLPNVIHYIDDILIFAQTREEHDRLVTEILRRLKNVGFSVCRDKCSFGQPAVTFLGHSITGSRISPDPLKLEALHCMQPPSNSAELNSFLGFVNYLARYVPNLAALAEPLRRLQTSKVHFAWTEEQETAFRAIKQALLSSPGLAPFDPTVPLEIATDASQNGLGGVLLQNGQPVLYVARALTPAESRYAIIEKELLAVVFVLSRCHFYTYGRPVTVKTDHKPLLGLVNSDVERLSLRLRRFIERLFPYNLTWEYVPGKDNHFPDALSRMGFRVPLTVQEQTEETSLSRSDAAQYNRLLEGGPIFRDIHDAAKDDVQFQALLKCAAHGWPPKLVKRDARRYLLQPYWALRNELRVLGSFLMWGDRVCVPRTLQARALALLHQGHPGINFMHQRARNVFYWPGITADTYRYVAQCNACVKCQALPPREPLLQEPPATYPGEHISADFFDLDGEVYLVACDAFSNFPFYAKVPSPSTAALIRALQVIFLQTGFPRVFQSDGGPAFRSEEFRAFLRSGACTHRVSSPRYAQSNGAAERVVRTIKTLKRKVHTAQDLFLAVLHLQNTPRPDTGLSPSQLFLGRTQRTPLIPYVRQFSRPWVAHAPAQIRRQRVQTAYYNQHAQVRPTLTWYPGQRAILRDPDAVPQTVEILGPAPQPRAFNVRLVSGTITTRNQRFLFPLSSPAVPSTPPADQVQRPPGINPAPRGPPHLGRPRLPANSRLASTSTARASGSPSPPYGSTAAGSRHLNTRSRQQPIPAPAPGPALPHLTTSTSSSGLVSSPLSLSPVRAASTLVSADISSPPSSTAAPPPSPTAPPRSVADARANVLGTSKSGRLVSASLKARESAATGQWRPQQIIRPLNRAPPQTLATGASPGTPPASTTPPEPTVPPPGPSVPPPAPGPTTAPAPDS
jgi:transposase InsO family protein